MFEALERQCARDSWLSIRCSEYLWSIQRTDDATHFLATNSFTSKQLAPMPELKVDEAAKRQLVGESKSALQQRAKSLGLPHTGNKPELASLIAKAALISDGTIAELERELKNSCSTAPLLHTIDGIGAISMVWIWLTGTGTNSNTGQMCVGVGPQSIS